jgi:hypothetical protein
MLHTLCHRHGRNARHFVILGVLYSQNPKVGRLPYEHDQKKDERFKTQASSNRSIAYNRGHGTGDTPYLRSQGALSLKAKGVYRNIKKKTPRR